MKSQRNIFICISIVLIVIIYGCSSEQDKKIVSEILVHRAEADSVFRHDPSSPFNRDSTIRFGGIKWFPPDVRYYFASKLFRYENPEMVIIFGTKGEERKHLKYGYFKFLFRGKEYKLNVYKFTTTDPERYKLYKNFLSVWFTDETTGKETYHVGRYVDVGEENSDTNYLYTLNLNHAYNPYCAYSNLYSCAIPRKEDHLDFPVQAGELKYHQ